MSITANRLSSPISLQVELRHLFANRPTNRALAESMQRIATWLGATAAVVHTRLGVHVLSEEWYQHDQEPVDATRERLNQLLWESVSAEESRLSRLGGDGSSYVFTAVVYDRASEPAGGAALLFETGDVQQAPHVMAAFEAMLGYIALLLDGGAASERRVASRRQTDARADATHPLRLARAILADLETRYGIELAGVGFVHGERVEVVATTGGESPRATNPGVTAMRLAMEECLDRGAAVVHGGDADEDCRLHAQWSRAANGSSVASFPLASLGETVAVVAVSQGNGARLTRQLVATMAEELSGYAALVPLSVQANRTWLAHGAASLRASLQRLLARRRARLAWGLVLFAAAATWLAFGTLRHSFTVPCVVKASERRTVCCPRGGVLAELFVRPGDRVRQGQLLASIDASDDFLRRAELAAEIEAVAAVVDQAVAERDSGKVRVNEARRNSLQAQLAVVDASIAEAQIRAPYDALVIEGDLREQLGSRLELGATMFGLARLDHASVELRIPEQLVLDARDWRTAEFAPASRPDRTHALGNLQIAPAGKVVDGRNVFLGEAEVALDLGLVPPGMEGIAHIDAGPRSAWWILTHRVTDWLHMNFWL